MSPDEKESERGNYLSRLKLFQTKRHLSVEWHPRLKVFIPRTDSKTAQEWAKRCALFFQPRLKLSLGKSIKAASG